MKITVFQSDKGDCLLVTSAGRKSQQSNILVDGGMDTSYRKFAAASLAKLKRLDLICVSHIDADHISGILQLLDDMQAWRVHNYQTKQQKNLGHPKPEFPCPPTVKNIWHNAFHEMVDKNQDVVNQLAANAAILSGASPNQQLLRELSTVQRELATSIPQAIRVSHRISKDQLGIPLNAHFVNEMGEALLAFVRQDQESLAPINFGSLKIYVIGPFQEDLEKLRKDWNKWLKNNSKTIAELKVKAEREAKAIADMDASQLLQLHVAQAVELGKRSNVTTPNLASLMLLVEEEGKTPEDTKTLLLTGDGHARDILKGLEFLKTKGHDRFDDAGRIHVDVLKVQHHGSKNNITEEFVRRVSADHYIFCGNGEHGNPHEHVLNLIIDSRLKRNLPYSATHPKALVRDGNRSRPFKMWFNSHDTASARSEANDHMKHILEEIQKRSASSEGQMAFRYVEKVGQDDPPSFVINI